MDKDMKDMLIRVHNWQETPLINYKKIKRYMIPVKYKEQIVGYAKELDDGRFDIQFEDNEVANSVQQMLQDDTVTVSARSRGEINEDEVIEDITTKSISIIDNVNKVATDWDPLGEQRFKNDL